MAMGTNLLHSVHNFPISSAFKLGADRVSVSEDLATIELRFQLRPHAKAILFALLRVSDHSWANSSPSAKLAENVRDHAQATKYP